MYIFNTTYHVENALCDEFVAWLRAHYIPTAMSHGALSEPRLSQVMVQEEGDGQSLALQFNVATLDDLTHWYDACGKALIEQLEQKYTGRVVGFTTIMGNIEI